MNARTRLPHRRSALAFEFEHGGLSYRAHVGFYPDGRIGELFLNAAKQNSAIDALAADAAILISLLAQHSASISEISHALRKTASGEPASLIGVALAELARLGAAP